MFHTNDRLSADEILVVSIFYKNEEVLVPFYVNLKSYALMMSEHKNRMGWKVGYGLFFFSI